MRKLGVLLAFAILIFVLWEGLVHIISTLHYFTPLLLLSFLPHFTLSLLSPSPFVCHPLSLFFCLLISSSPLSLSSPSLPLPLHAPQVLRDNEAEGILSSKLLLKRLLMLERAVQQNAYHRYVLITLLKSMA